MARVRSDNDNRYVLRQQLVDASGKPIKGDTITIGQTQDRNIDGGKADSVYAPEQIITGGTASG